MYDVQDKVKFRSEVLTEEFLVQYGTICRDLTWTVRKVERNSKGKVEYIIDPLGASNLFARCVSPEHIELVY